MNVAQLITALEKLPPDSPVEAWNGIQDEPMPVTTVDFCSDSTVFISALTAEQYGEEPVLDFASHKIGDSVEFLNNGEMEPGRIVKIDESGMAEVLTRNGETCFRDLCALHLLPQPTPAQP